MNQRLKHETWYYKIPNRKHKEEGPWIWHQKHKQEKKKPTNGTTLNLSFAQQKKQLTTWKGNIENGRKILQTSYLIIAKIYKERIQFNNKTAFQLKMGRRSE